MSSRIGVSALPVFFKYSVHSTVGKSRYSIATHRTLRPVAGSLQSKGVLGAPIVELSEARSYFQSFRNSDEGRPP